MSDENDRQPDDEEDEKSIRSGVTAYLHLSSFAWTLVIVSCVMGYLGHLLGSFLGEPWNAIFMVIFGLVGFGLEMWRMIRKVSDMAKKKP